MVRSSSSTPVTGDWQEKNHPGWLEPAITLYGSPQHPDQSEHPAAARFFAQPSGPGVSDARTQRTSSTEREEGILMSTVEPYLEMNGYNPLPAASGSRLGRHVGRSLTHIDASTSVQLARINSAADTQAAKIDALTCVARKAMQDVALLSQMQAQLAAVLPDASERMAAIADRAAAAMTDVVLDTARHIGR
jgi:hypothetical protein